MGKQITTQVHVNENYNKVYPHSRNIAYYQEDKEWITSVHENIQNTPTLVGNFHQ